MALPFYLLYASKATDHVAIETVRAIWQQSLRNNSKLGLTGALLFTSKVFVQCLEGERSVVNALYHKIARDPRHEQVTILLSGDRPDRQFGKWSMAFLGAGEAHVELMLKYSDNDLFDPFLMDGRSCLNLLIDLSLQAHG